VVAAIFLNCVMPGIRLSEISTKAPEKEKKDDVKQKTAKLLGELDELQNRLFAEGKHSVLVILQGLDGSGKDGVIRKVFGNLSPQGVSVRSFKVPTAEELAHDFLWRIHLHAPARGMIQIFNRSHYEDVLVTRVHGWCDDEMAKKRMKAINDFEQLLYEHNSCQILKFYLHVSEKERRTRLEERRHDPSKMWKYSEKDLKEAELTGRYMEMYEDCFEHCDLFPWQIIPSDQNWYKEYLIAKALHKMLSGLNMKYPKLKK